MDDQYDAIADGIPLPTMFEARRLIAHHIRCAVEAEREACASLIEQRATGRHGTDKYGDAEAIRARK